MFIKNIKITKIKKKKKVSTLESLIAVFMVVVDSMLKQGLNFMAYTSALDGFFRTACIAS